MRQILNKKECRKFAQPKAKFDLQSGIFHCEQVKFVVTAAVKIIDRHKTLVCSIFPVDKVADGCIFPQYVLFQTKQDFVTLEYQDKGKTRWRQCQIDALQNGYYFLQKCAFYQVKDEEIVKKYCNGAEKKGLIALDKLQDRIKDVKLQERRTKRLQAIALRMKCVPPTPRGLKGYVHNAILPQFIFYDYIFFI